MVSFSLKWLISWQSIVKCTDELKVYFKEFECLNQTYKVFAKLLTVDKRQVNNN